MARLFAFVCDGCDRRVESPENELPSCWGDVRLRIEGYGNFRSDGGPTVFMSRLLCPQCQLHLQDTTDPKKWPRHAEAAT